MFKDFDFFEIVDETNGKEIDSPPNTFHLVLNPESTGLTSTTSLIS